MLAEVGEKTNLSLMLSSYGLSLNDHYWMQPIGMELYWKEINFYQNPFSDELEFVSAYQLIRNEKIRNDKSVYEALIAKAASVGGYEAEIRKQLEYTILTDFILSNTDRHLNNFGFLYHSGSRCITAMAPIFDTGNALFYNEDFIPSGENLLDVKVTSFCEKEVQLLRYVENRELVDLKLLDGFPAEAAKMLEKYTEMPQKRAEAIAGTIEKKMELLQKFQHGAKLWKPEKYWW